MASSRYAWRERALDSIRKKLKGIGKYFGDKLILIMQSLWKARTVLSYPHLPAQAV